MFNVLASYPAFVNSVFFIPRIFCYILYSQLHIANGPRANTFASSRPYWFSRYSSKFTVLIDLLSSDLYAFRSANKLTFDLLATSEKNNSWKEQLVTTYSYELFAPPVDCTLQVVPEAGQLCHWLLFIFIFIHHLMYLSAPPLITQASSSAMPPPSSSSGSRIFHCSCPKRTARPVFLWRYCSFEHVAHNW